MLKVNPTALSTQILIVSELREMNSQFPPFIEEHLDGLMNMLEAIRDDFMLHRQTFVVLERDNG